MWKHLYGILAVVFLCTWKAKKTDANDVYGEYVLRFYLYNDYDLLYNKFNTDATNEMRQNAQAYVRDNPHRFVKPDHIIKQHIYISSIRSEICCEDFENLRKAVMLNFIFTVEAYFAAVDFRVCAFFYKFVKRDWLTSSICSDVSSYMEWYFSFMLKEKAEDLCNMKSYFDMETDKLLKAEYVCEILKKLNLNFLRIPGDRTFIDLLQNDENNIYKADKLAVYDSNGERHFASVFERFQLPSKTVHEIQSKYEKKIYYKIWSSIMDAYTNKFSKLFSYYLEVIEKKPYKVHVMPKVTQCRSMQNIWKNAFMFHGIMNLRTEDKRGVVYSRNIESYIGSVIYRSNAVEILRQLSYHFVFPAFVHSDVDLKNRMAIVCSSNSKCSVILAPDNLSVDYCFEINPM